MSFELSLQRIFLGKNIITKHISLFALCGISGILEVYLLMNKFTFPVGVLFAGIIIFLELYFTGYETLFMQKRELPEFDMLPLKIALKKLPLFVFLVSLLFLGLSFVPDKYSVIFTLGILVSIPLSILQAGFSYNFENKDAFEFIQKFSGKDYFILFLKKIVIIFLCDAMIFVLMLAAIIVFGIAYALLHGGNVTQLLSLILSHHDASVKLVAYVFGVLMSYIVFCGFLAWDYELIKMKEN